MIHKRGPERLLTMTFVLIIPEVIRTSGDVGMLCHMMTFALTCCVECCVVFICLLPAFFLV